MRKIRAFLYLLVASSFMLTGCGGGGGGPAAAEISPSNVVDLAVAATEGMKSSASASEAPISFDKTGSQPTISTNKLISDLAQYHYATIDLSGLCTTGSFLIDDQTGVTTIADCVIYDGYSSFTLNGTISFIPAGSGFSFTANLSFAQNGNTESITGSGTCDAQFNCSMTASYTGIDGRTYTTANMDVSGDNFSGYSVSGTITDPDHGNITIATNTPVTFNCADGRPDAGQITVTAGGTATVDFIDCTSFSVDFNGSTNTYLWADF